MLEHDIVLLMLLIVGGISALGANSHGIDGTSLKSALNAINRKQRFYKYYGDDLNEKKFQRNRRATGHDIEDEDDDIEFLPIGINNSNKIAHYLINNEPFSSFFFRKPTGHRKEQSISRKRFSRLFGKIKRTGKFDPMIF